MIDNITPAIVGQSVVLAEKQPLPINPDQKPVNLANDDKIAVGENEVARKVTDQRNVNLSLEAIERLEEDEAAKAARSEVENELFALEQDIDELDEIVEEELINVNSKSGNIAVDEEIEAEEVVNIASVDDSIKTLAQDADIVEEEQNIIEDELEQQSQALASRSGASDASRAYLSTTVIGENVNRLI